MKRLPVAEEDRRSVADWYDRWSGFVADVDFKPARAMFAEDAIAFGTKVEVMTSQAAARGASNGARSGRRSRTSASTPRRSRSSCRRTG